MITDSMVHDKVLLSTVGQQGGHLALPAVGERPHLLLLCLKPHLHLVSTQHSCNKNQDMPDLAT